MSVSKTQGNLSKKNLPETLDVELTCPICLKIFSEPVSLPCGHTYCLVCLQTMGEGLDQHSCPECHTVYQGPTATEKNLKMHCMVDIYKANEKISSTTSPAEVSHVAHRRHDSALTDEFNTRYQQELAAAKQSQELCEEGRAKDGLQIASAYPHRPCSLERSSGKSKTEMDEPKFRLASQITELNLKLEMEEVVLKKERGRELELTTANAQLREKVSRLLGQINDLSQCYSRQVMQMIEEELGPGEATLDSRVSRASELTRQLRQATLRAESLLTEKDDAAFSSELRSLQPHIVELMAKTLAEEEDHAESKVSFAQVCPKLETMNIELRDRFGEVQRSLRNVLNPSEVTFDPETAHPNLILSEDLKTVTFSATKQPYPLSPQRFTSFFQVLSTQSFSDGDHTWEVELEGSPWIIGVCYSGKLARSGLPSALESSRSSWCLMWFNNLLTAFEQSHSVPLKKTTVSRKLQIKLSFKTHRLSFFNISPISGKTHVYTFKANLTEPVHLAYRMMSGDPKGRLTIHS